MSRIESGKTELVYEPFNLLHYLYDTGKSLTYQMEQNEISLAGSYVDIIHENVIGSKLHLQRIILNILSNSIKYNHPGGSITCWLKEYPQDETHSVYEFKIQDTGIGMFAALAELMLFMCRLLP